MGYETAIGAEQALAKLSLTVAENEKVRAVLAELGGEGYPAEIEATARANAEALGFTRDGYEAKRSIAPHIIDLLYAYDPNFRA